MQLISLLLIGFAAFSSIAQVANNDERDPIEIELNWKLAEGDSLFYKTEMEPIEESSFSIDMDGVFDSFPDSTRGDSSKIDPKDIVKDLSESLRERVNNLEMLSILSNSPDFDDVIDIEMVSKKKEVIQEEQPDESSDRDVVDDIKDFTNSMLEGTMLRGSVNKDGSLHSFWVKSRQKNLLCMFFELPKGKLKKGDTWQLDNISYVGNDQNFRCRKAEKRNLVQLVDIKVVEGETIAVLEYDLYEFVSGEFSRFPIFSSEKAKEKPTTMYFAFKAKAEFSVDQGKWLNYSGILSTESTGFMESKEVQRISLIEK